MDYALRDVNWNKHFLNQVALVMVFYDTNKNPRICHIRISRIGIMNHLDSRARLRKGDIPERHASEREVIYKIFLLSLFFWIFIQKQNFLYSPFLCGFWIYVYELYMFSLTLDTTLKGRANKCQNWEN